jgi:hypothetical protein
MQVLRRMDARTDRFPFSSFDYAAGSAEATRHLIATGARGSPSSAVSTNGPSRRNGWPGISPRWPEAGLPLAGGGTDLARLRAERRHAGCGAITPIATPWSASTIWWRWADRRACSATGSTVGRDIRVVGFDDIEEAALAWPDLSSVACDIARVRAGYGARAARLAGHRHAAPGGTARARFIWSRCAPRAGGDPMTPESTACARCSTPRSPWPTRCGASRPISRRSRPDASS